MEIKDDVYGKEKLAYSVGSNGIFGSISFSSIISF